jgi:hypothetical protein
MRGLVYCFAGFAAAGLVSFSLAAEDGSRPNLSGTWQLDAAKSDMQLNKVSDLTMVIAEQDDSINISETETLNGGKERKVNYHCSVDGKDCSVPEDDSKASFWYNGATLVSMETKRNGSEVLKQRITLSPDSKTLTVEISSVVPQSDKKDKLVLEKR